MVEERGGFPRRLVWCLPGSSLRRKPALWSGCVWGAPSLRAGFNGTSRRGKPPAPPFVARATTRRDLERWWLVRVDRWPGCGNLNAARFRIHRLDFPGFIVTEFGAVPGGQD